MEMHSIDSIQKIQIKVAPKLHPVSSENPARRTIAIRQAARQIVLAQPVSAPRAPKHIALFGFFDRKQIATIAATFIITFALSLATSQTLAAHSPDNNTAAGAPGQSQLADNGLAVVNVPQLASLSETVLEQPGEVYLPEEKLKLPNPLQQRQEFLQKYLSAKGSVLADHVDAISEQSQWKLIIAISRAESSFCKHKQSYNCWGIGGAWDLKKYSSYDQAVADVNRILEEHYIQAGLDTPEKIVYKYVGHANQNWELAVQQELDNLKNVQ